MFLLDYIRQRWQPRGSVVSAGVPPEARPATVLLPAGLVARHLHACADLPHDAATEAALAHAISDPAAIQHGARAIAKSLIESGRVHPELQPLQNLIAVLLAELARTMYINAAQAREGAIGIRLLAETGNGDAKVMTLVTQDLYGLGPGVYPFGAVPGNPSPGKRCGFYVRVVTAP